MSKRAPVSLALIANTARYYTRQRRWVALGRALGETVVFRWGGELCERCGRRNRFVWAAPSPLWDEVNGRYGGLICPRCFDAALDALGYRATWMPMVTARHSQATTNHWDDETRDWLMVGQPDPDYFINGKVNYPQPPWAAARQGLEAAGYVLPPIDYYPAENRHQLGGAPP